MTFQIYLRKNNKSAQTKQFSLPNPVAYIDKGKFKFEIRNLSWEL